MRGLKRQAAKSFRDTALQLFWTALIMSVLTALWAFLWQPHGAWFFVAVGFFVASLLFALVTAYLAFAHSEPAVSIGELMRDELISPPEIRDAKTNPAGQQSAASKGTPIGAAQAAGTIKPAPARETTGPKSLHQLFRTDFPHHLTIHQGYEITATNQITGEIKGKITCELQLHADLGAQAEFISLYIPQTPVPTTEFICQTFLDKYKEAIKKLKEGVGVEGGLRGERPTNLNELRFTGRVYIYHETPMMTDQMERIESLYRRRKLFIIFRGQMYAYEHNNPTPMPPGTAPL